MAESRALSQWEIDALLTQIPEGESEQSSDGAAVAPAISQPDRAFTRQIKSYDFRRPDKFSKEQWTTLQVMNETFARLASAAFSSRLRTLSQVRLSSIDQGLYEEWQTQVPGQTVCYVLSLQPLAGNIVVEFNHDVASEVIDRLLGGTGLLLDRGREFGEIEMVLLRSFATTIGASLNEMWSAVAPISAELQDVSLDVGLVQVANPNDVVISAFFEVSIAEHLGAMSMWVPYAVLEPIASKLSAQIWHGGGAAPESTPRTRAIVSAALNSASVEISVELGSVEIPVSAVLQMSEGDTLLLDSRPEHLLPMFVGGEHRFLCRPGTVGNQIGIRVHELVEEQVLDLSEFDEDEDEAESRAADEAGDDDRRVIDFPTPDETPAETEPSAIAGDGAAGELPDASLTAPIEEAASA